MNLNRLGAEQINDTGVSQEIGKPVADPNAQVSQAAKQTEKPQQARATEPPADPFKPVQFDPTARYYHPNKPDRVISGDELYTGYNRGLQFDKVQGDLHKTQSEYEKVTARNKELEDIVAKQNNMQMIQDLMKQQGISQESKSSVARDTGSELNNWLTGDEGENDMNTPPQQLSPQQLQKLIQDTVANQFSMFKEQNQDVINQSLASLRSATQSQAAQEQAFMTGNKVMETDLVTSYPNAAKAEIDEIVRLENAKLYSGIAASDASKTGDMAAMEEHLEKAATFSNKSRALQLKLAKENDVRQREAEDRAYLEDLTAPVERGYQDERAEWEAELTPIERKYKQDEVKADNAAKLKKAYQMADATEKFHRNYPNIKKPVR